jgi:hypothetical protein
VSGFVVLYDACVLYPAPLRDLLLRLAQAGVVRARWTELILDEAFRNILANRPDLSASSLVRTRDLMNRAVPDCIVHGYESLIEGLVLPDADDRHVVAAAIKAGAQVIVTFNLVDFPDAVLGLHDMEAKHPDDFVMNQLDLAPGLVCQAVVEQAAALKSPPRTVADLLGTLREQGLVQSVARLRGFFLSA